MSGLISVIVIDDHSLFRSGVINALQSDEQIMVIGEAGTSLEAVSLASNHAPDLALIDISMPGGGIETARQILEDTPGIKVVMLTASENENDLMRSLDAGASGYLLKGIRAADLLVAVKSVAAGECYISPSLTGRLLSGVRTESKASIVATLSRQEQRTLRLVATGHSNREVGAQLGIAEKTVKYHLANIFTKLGVRNRVEASLMARGEIEMPEMTERLRETE